MMTFFDSQLRQRSRQGGVHGGDFFGRQFFAETRGGALPSLLSLGFIDAGRGNCHIGCDRNVGAGDFDQACAHGDKVVVTSSAHQQFAGDNASHQINVVGEHAQLPPDAVRSFELFRNQVSGVDIVTFDELAEKVRQLLTLLVGT